MGHTLLFDMGAVDARRGLGEVLCNDIAVECRPRTADADG